MQTVDMLRFDSRVTATGNREITEPAGAVQRSGWRKAARRMASWVGLMIGFAATAPAAVPPGYTVRNWQTEDGLPQNSVRCLVQTRDGYLWLGTFDGLVRFDGVRFTSFTLASVPELRSHQINALFEDGHGTLWIGTEMGGLSYYREGRFGTVAKESGLVADSIDSLSEDSAGTLWVGSPDGLFRSQGDRFSILAMPEDFPERVYNAKPGAKEFLWLWGDGGLVRLRNGIFEQIQACTNGVTAIEADSNGGVWCWVRDIGLFQVDQNGSARHIAGVDGDWVNSILCARDGVLWLADRSRGLMRWEGGQTTVYTTADGLAANEISVVREDREGNLWVGTNGGGLHRLRHRMVQVYSTRDGLSSDDVMSVSEGSEGQVWIGTFGGGLNRLEGGVFRQYRWPKCDNVVALCPIPGGPLWVGTYAHGLVRWEAEQLNKDPSPCGPIIRALCRDRKGRLWVGSGRNGLHCLDQGRWTTCSTAEGLSHRTVTCLIEDRAGQIWVGTPQGLNRLADGRLQRFGRDDGLAVEAIHSLFEDSAGTVWVGTSGGGLARYRDGRFRCITTLDGLANDVVAQILEDDRGFFWLGSNGGIMRVRRQELNDCADGQIAAVHCYRYGQAEGLMKAECTGGYQPACMKARDGALWFCTVGGLVVVDPARIRENRLAPPVYIEQVVMDRETTDLRRWNTAVSTAAGSSGSILSPPPVVRVPPHTHRLEFHYTALTFSAPEWARFRYRLEGWDDDWIEAGTRRAAYYTRVPPGRYQFRVAACNNDGVWNLAGAAVDVIVRAPWYRTGWAYLGGGLLATGLVVGFYEGRLHRLRQARALQANFSRRLIESQEADRKRTAKELHDGLGQNLILIKNRAEYGLQRLEPALPVADQLRQISEAAGAALNDLRATSLALHPYELDRLGLTQAIEAMVQRAGEPSSTKFLTDLDDLEGLLPPETQIQLYRILQEGVNNVLKHARAAGAILELKREPGRVRATLLDDGRGFDLEGLSVPGRTGWGLQGIAERATLIGGKLQLQSAPGRGTRLDVTIPLPPHPDE